VSATYTEYRIDAVYPRPSECQRVISKTMTAVPSLPLPALRVGASYEEGRFRLQTPGGCAATYAPDPLSVSV
jgi:hypothetical protein